MTSNKKKKRIYVCGMLQTTILHNFPIFTNFFYKTADLSCLFKYSSSENVQM